MPPLPWSALLASGTYWVSSTSKELADNANHQGASEVPPSPWSERNFYFADRLSTYLKLFHFKSGTTPFNRACCRGEREFPFPSIPKNESL